MRLILGTAKWGDEISFDVAYSFLEEWVNCGNVRIDTATNYPINGKQSESSITYLERLFCSYNTTFDVTLKIGSISRNRIPDFDLSVKKIRETVDEYYNRLGRNLRCVMVHWDNRNNYNDIYESLYEIKASGFRVGISGISDLDTYSKVINDLNIHVEVQLKYSNINTYLKYLSPQINSFCAYRVSQGMESYEQGLLTAKNDPLLSEILIGPKNLEQLKKSILC